MGWKGTLRSVNASINRMERESKKRARELEKRRKEYEKLEELEKAALEVDEYNNYIERIQSIHKEVSPKLVWNDFLIESYPSKPTFCADEINELENKYRNFTGSFFQKLFKTVEKNKEKLALKIESLREKEEILYKKRLEEYNLEIKSIDEKKELSKKIIENDKNSILEAINEFDIFSEISEFGSELYLNFDEDILDIEIKIFSTNIVPLESKSLLKSGKLSVKKLTKSTYNEIYQDYVCSVILRVAREVFSLVPLEKVRITALDEILDKKTGHKNFEPIVSALIVKETIDTLNLDMIDTSDSMDNFLHNMKFKKTVGFAPIEIINVEQL